jgi:hypothetical protein
MKKLIILTLVAGIFTSCGSNSTEESTDTVAGNFGNTEWDASEAISSDELLGQLAGKDSVFVTLDGTIKAACQAKGCWMTMDAGNQELFVKFKDYGFFVPMNSADHKATMQGWAYADTVSVKDQIEYAKDAEASAEEIAAITEPEVKLTFMADGVVIK